MIKPVFKKALFLLTIILLCSCNNNTNKTSKTEKKEVTKQITNNITGKWISINDYVVKDIFISTSDYKTFNFKITFKDGSVKTEITKLTSMGEYRTNNEFGEYYKLKGNTLGIYDRQGIIGYYKR